MAGPLLTIGHGASDGKELAGRLRDAGVEVLVDVRRFPGSRRNPEVARESLEASLPAAGLRYRWEERLGGRRRLPADEPSPDDWWRVTSFRAYAAHTRTPEFAQAMDALVATARTSVTAVMCSENVWWRCHRRLVSDVAVLLHDLPVLHVMPDGRTREHDPSPTARVVAPGRVEWPAEP